MLCTYICRANKNIMIVVIIQWCSSRYHLHPGMILIPPSPILLFYNSNCEPSVRYPVDGGLVRVRRRLAVLQTLGAGRAGHVETVLRRGHVDPGVRRRVFTVLSNEMRRLAGWGSGREGERIKGRHTRGRSSRGQTAGRRLGCCCRS